jgi:alkylhydroperoxidase family enzyme
MTRVSLWLSMLAIALIAAMNSNAGAADDPHLLTPLSLEETWKAMPAVETGSGSPLPSWARMLARSLPRTTAALLELDLAQRTKSPLDPKLRASMRWVAAHANNSRYGEAYAAFDAGRAGMSEAAIASLTKGDHSALSTGEKAALEFARKMTVESSRVTDDEFGTLVKEFGERKTAAMVLLMAYANFQDRLLICLGVPVEKDGPMPPVNVKFVAKELASRGNPTAPPAIPDLAKPTGKDLIADDPSWSALTYDQLQKKLEIQKKKPTRLRVPTWEEVKKTLPPGVSTAGTRVVWSLIAYGYAPELAHPWENVMWVNGEENGKRFDRVFGLSLFWIVTRAIDCPYCMGHCEMNWEVIGMTPAQIAERSRQLAGDDWSSFPPSEQRVFAFARKLTQAPGLITRDDVKGVVADYGVDSAVSIMTYACRCNYMVRVSNGFQLSLERDNVFYDYYKMKPPTSATGK